MRLLPAIMIFLCSACTNPGTPIAMPSVPDKPASQMISCPETRPQMCTKEYLPVCASRDTGIRCVTQPCPSMEWKTYGNACDACADTKVFAYVKGACKPVQ